MEYIPIPYKNLWVLDSFSIPSPLPTSCSQVLSQKKTRLHVIRRTGIVVDCLAAKVTHPKLRQKLWARAVGIVGLSKNGGENIFTNPDKPLKMVVSNRNLLFKGSIFRGYVSFREGKEGNPWKLQYTFALFKHFP